MGPHLTPPHLALIVLAVVGVLSSGCQAGSAGGVSAADAGVDTTGADTDSSTDTDTDTDTASPSACTECPAGEVCISRVRGRLLYEDGTPVTGIEAVVKFHIKVCYVVEPDADGYFEVMQGCYHKEEPFFMEIPSIIALDGARTRYAVEYDPTREQVADEGPDDFIFDVGTQYFWALPTPTATYSAEAGAAVSQAGVEFDVAPGALGAEDLELGVFEFPLESWIPPFIDNPFNAEWTVDHADALYYLTPYWQPVVEGEGIVLRIDPPTGWTADDTGTVHLLGDWVYEYLELPEHGEVGVGRVVDLGPISYEDGKLVTPLIPILGWVILVKD